MKNHISLKKKSQFDENIKKRYRNSACGPVTAYAILDHYLPNKFQNINDLYRKLGGTPIGLFTWRFVRNLSKLLGDDWLVKKCSIEETIRQIDAGRPVAAKFDKWFTGHWRGRYSYDYHWVSVVGYEEKENVFHMVSSSGHDCFSHHFYYPHRHFVFLQHDGLGF